MRTMKAYWRSAFDIREGERLRTLFMALYLLLVMFAHYIMKPISRGMFLERFNIDKLPVLYLLLAVAGGLLATLYTRAALRASLQAAVAWATAVSLLSFVGFWWAFQFNWKWLLYVFNLWANLFGVVTVAQGWLVAGNVYTSREAKRLYGVLALGATLGSLAGSGFTNILVKKVGPRPLVLVCALVVILAYVAYRLAVAQKGASLARARAAEAEEAQAHVRDLVTAVGRHRHLQVIIGIISLIFVVDVLVDYQYNYMAGRYMSGKISAFLAGFDLYANLLTFALQLFVTPVIVSRLGVGGMMQVMPVTMAVVSIPVLLVPGLVSTVAAALAENASRYSFNRTGVELLYMPLPADLRNRTKAFVDIAVDRTGRGLAAVLLLILGWFGIQHPRQIALFVIALAVFWVLLSRRVQKEYILTVRKRLDTRRLDLEGVRVAVTDPATLALLEQAAAAPNPRQVCYALTLLAEAPGYDAQPLLRRLAASPSAEVRGKVYELTRSLKFPELRDDALAEVRSPRPGDEPALRPAVAYVLSVSPEAPRLAGELLDHPDCLVGESVLEAARSGEAVQGVVTLEWITRNSESQDPRRRRLAAIALGVHGDRGTQALHRLLADQDSTVVAAAARSAGALRNRAYVPALVRRLAEARLRAEAIEALAAYGTRISGTLGDLLEDETVPAPIRRQIPRILYRVPEQPSVDVLLRFIGAPDLSLRAAVVKALNRLREAAPQLDYGAAFVTRQILNEARHYFELNAALEPFRTLERPRTAPGLLARTIEVRLQNTIERLFRLLGLRYRPKEIHAAYLAVSRRRTEELSAALDFLDNVLDWELRRVLLPLLDAPAHLAEKGRDLFGIEVLDVESALRELIRSGDPWLVACASATAAELGTHNLAQDIAQAAEGAGKEAAQVAHAAAAALA